MKYFGLVQKLMHGSQLWGKVEGGLPENLEDGKVKEKEDVGV